MLERGISLVKAAEEIHKGRFTEYLNMRGQRVFVVNLENYPVELPTVETEEHIFIKTAYRSRKWKAKLGGDHETN